MKEQNDTTYPERIQQLADGQLAFDERSKFLRAIDREEPSCWRDVALALVEKEVLKEAASVEEGSKRSVTPIWLAAAACLAFAGFAFGWVLHPESAVEPGFVQPSAPAVASAEVNLPLPSTDLIRRANEKLAPTGYGASMVTRYVRANLGDGSQLVIPVSQVMLGYRGE